MKLAGFLLILVHTVLGAGKKKHFYASITELEDLFNYEKDMLYRLETHIYNLQNNLDGLRGKLQEIRESRYLVEDVPRYLQNPLNSFLYIKSLNDYGESLGVGLKPISDMQHLFNEIDQKGGWPGIDDVEGAARAIIRLQTTYNLKVDQLASGKIHNFTSLPLTASDCMTIGLAGNKKDQIYLINEWLRKAFELCNQTSDVDACDSNLMMSVMENYAYSEFNIGNLEKAFEVTKALLKLNPKNKRVQNNHRYLSDEINNIHPSQRNGEFMLDPDGTLDTEKFYHFSCQGLAKPKKQDQSKLTCQLVHYNNPYLKLGPIKVEEMYLEPRIVLIREMMFDSEIEKIKNISRTILKRSETLGGFQNDVRVSKLAWLNPTDNPTAQKLSTRFSIYSDLSPRSAESLQVVNYGLGGQYLGHLDAFDEDEATKEWGSLGNRIGTLLVYMNEVDKGGDTAFTKLGISVKPEKGTGVLWYNLHNDGTVNRETLHAACPVLVGTKWAINVWYHLAFNEFTKPCLPKSNKKISSSTK